ncbi:MAG: PDZ domain-containing protein [Verrucomicrobiota bacterium]
MRLTYFAAVLCFTAASHHLTLAAPATPPPQPNVVRVNVTSQAYDFSRPWSKRAPVSKRALGAVLQGQRVIVTAECVANATYIELESADGERKQAASVESVDYEANLALLKTDGSDFLQGMPGLAIAPARIGDTLSVWQLEANGNLMISKGQMTTAEVTRYPIDESAFLVYRVSVPLQMRDASATLPVIHDGKLAGLMLRYEASSNLLDLIPAPVVEHFLKDTARKPYEGFPRMGLSFSPTRDPQLRHYLGLDGTKGGVLVTQTLPKGPANSAEIQKGDVIVEIDGTPIDADGNYQDSDYGRISLGHLVTTKHFEGEGIPIKIIREGKPLQKTIHVARRHPETFLSPPYVFDSAPRYFVLGGLVLQELSRTYLKEFGNDWTHKAPPELLNIDRTQSELQSEDQTRVVFMSRVLPSDVTIGYEELRHQVVRAINGVSLKSLQDVPTALKQVRDGVHSIELAGDPHQIFLDAKSVEEIAPLLQRNYRLPALSRLE